jgi:hypothetical protein
MTAFANVEAIRAAKTSELVAYWNEHNEKQITKFADRLTAEKRCEGLMERLKTAALVKSVEEGPSEEVGGSALDPVQDDGEPEFQEDAEGEESQDGEGDANGTPATATGNPFAALVKGNAVEGHEALPEDDKFIKADKRKSNRAGVQASWNDPEVRAARQTRDSVFVTVDGSTSGHKSTRSAFRDFLLPDSKHIRFRMKLKEAGSATFEHNGKTYLFTIAGADGATE